jgi:hypothetical protein
MTSDDELSSVFQRRVTNFTLSEKFSNFKQLHKFYERTEHLDIYLLTGNIQVSLGFRRQSHAISWLARIPATVLFVSSTDDQASVGVDAGPRQQPGDLQHVESVVEPAVGDVVRMTLGLAIQFDARSFDCRRILWRNHNIGVTCDWHQ